MRKYVLSVFVFLQFLSLFAASVPKWVSDVDSEFPKEKYIARLGSGNTVENARTDALGQIAGFFKSEVVVNTKHKIALFYAERNKKEVRIPDGIETISTYCFDEYGYFRRDFHENAYFGTTLIPVEKVIIPKSVKTLYSSAFCYCDNLTSVIYEGKSSDLKIKSNPFKDCKNFTWFDSKILCSDTPKTNEKKTPGMRFERLILIHRAIASGSYPNSENLRQLCKRKLGLRGLGLSTISRDIEFLRNRFYAPIEYDHIKRGYFYSEDFSLNFDADGINTREEFMRSLG